MIVGHGSPASVISQATRRDEYVNKIREGSMESDQERDTDV